MAPRGGNLQGIRNMPTMLGGMPLMPGSRGQARQYEAIARAGGSLQPTGIGAQTSMNGLPPQLFGTPGGAGPGQGAPGGGGGGYSTGGGLTAPGVVAGPSSNPALDKFNDLYQRNTEGSTQSFNLAANRLRERLDSAGTGAAQNLQSNALSRGFVGGNLQGSLQDLEAQKLGAYGQGLVGLQSEFERNRLQGLNQAQSNAEGISGDYGSAQDRALKEWLAQYQGGVDLQISREGNKTQTDINKINQNSRSLQDLLDNLVGVIGQGGSY